MEKKIPQVKVYCEICYENYNEKEKLPKISSVCGHVFCLKCLISWQKNLEGILTCPTCSIDLSKNSYIRDWPTVKAFLPDPARFDAHPLIQLVLNYKLASANNAIVFTSDAFKNITADIIFRFWKLYCDRVPVGTNLRFNFLKMEDHDSMNTFCSIGNSFLRHLQKDIKWTFIACDFMIVNEQTKNLQIIDMNCSKWQWEPPIQNFKLDTLGFIDCQLDETSWTTIMKHVCMPKDFFSFEDNDITLDTIISVIKLCNSTNIRINDLKLDNYRKWNYPEDFPESLLYPCCKSISILGDIYVNNNLWLFRKLYFKCTGKRLSREKTLADIKPELIEIGETYPHLEPYSRILSGHDVEFTHNIKRFNRSPLKNCPKTVAAMQLLIKQMRGIHVLTSLASFQYFLDKKSNVVCAIDDLYKRKLCFKELYKLVLPDNADDVDNIPVYERNSFLGDVDAQMHKTVFDFYESKASRRHSMVLKVQDAFKEIYKILTDTKLTLMDKQSEWLKNIADIRTFTTNYNCSFLSWEEIDKIAAGWSAKKQKIEN